MPPTVYRPHEWGGHGALAAPFPGTATRLRNPLRGRKRRALPVSNQTLAWSIDMSPGARLTLHRDRSENSFDHPIVPVPFGLPAMFPLGGGHATRLWRRCCCMVMWRLGAASIDFASMKYCR